MKIPEGSSSEGLKGTILTPGDIGQCREIFSVFTAGGQTRNAATHPTMHRAHHKELPSQHVSGAKMKERWSNPELVLYIQLISQVERMWDWVTQSRHTLQAALQLQSSMTF